MSIKHQQTTKQLIGKTGQKAENNREKTEKNEQRAKYKKERGFNSNVHNLCIFVSKDTEFSREDPFHLNLPAMFGTTTITKS